jgi:hypothetical protein
MDIHSSAPVGGTVRATAILTGVGENGGGWSTLNLTAEGAPPFRVCFLKGWAILLFALS